MMIVYPTFKGSERTYRFCMLRALHTMSGRGPTHHRTAGDRVALHRPAQPVDHLAIIGPVRLGQTRTTRPPLLGSPWRLCSLGPAGHGYVERADLPLDDAVDQQAHDGEHG